MKNIPVAYEDEQLIIVNKPPGLLTVAGPNPKTYNLTDILNREFPIKGQAYNLHPCHRLDKETSGLVMYAKGKAAQKTLMDLFMKQLVHKAYIAFVQGNLKNRQGIIATPIDKESAKTQYRLIQQKALFAIVEVIPQTGRKNQIRIHFKNIGHPLVGETCFAFRKDFSLRAKRVCLHAQKLEFVNPITNKPIAVECPLPRDMQSFLDKFTQPNQPRRSK